MDFVRDTCPRVVWSTMYVKQKRSRTGGSGSAKKPPMDRSPVTDLELPRFGAVQLDAGKALVHQRGKHPALAAGEVD
jgi:hypothetical protein